MPAAFNGLYGIRPSFGRLPYLGAANSMPGQNTIPSVCGPLASSARALKLMFRSTLAQQPWLHDPAVVEMPWREDIVVNPPANGGKLCFGLFASDDVVAPLPPVKRALEIVKDLIRKMGHEIIEWAPPSHQRAMEIAVRLGLRESPL
jgi:amidase